MAQQQARDEAGNIWYVDDAGNPVGLAQAAPQGGGSVVAPNPVQAQRQSVDLGGAQLGNQKTAQQIALEAAKVPYAPRQAAADTTKAEAEAAAAQLTLQKAQRDASLPVAGQTGRANLQRAIDDIRQRFAAGPGRTSGVGGLLDYLPTTENQQFDAAGNAVRGFVGPALGLTGGQLNTEKEAQRAVGPYIPQSGDRDQVILDKIARLQGLANAMGGNRQQQTQQQNQQQPQMIAASGGGGSGNPPPPTGPAGYDVAGVAGGVSGGPGGAGSTFADAAGVGMATKLKQAYNQGGGVQQLNPRLTENGYQPFADPQAIEAINKRGPLNFAPPQAADNRSGLSQMLGGAADSSGGAYAISAADALSAGTLDNIAGGSAKLAEEYAAQKFPGATLAGQVTGGALAAGAGELGLARLGVGAGRAALGGDALYGAAYGAGSTDDGSRLLGAVGGGVGGLAGGIAGRAAARGIGGALTGVQNADVRGLRAAGVPLTAGQALSQSGGAFGRGVQMLENATTGLPGVGAVTRGRYTDGFEGLNRAAFDEGLAPIGANTGGVVREQGVDLARQARSQGYSDALDPVNVQADAPLVQDMQAAINAGRALPDPMRSGLDYTLPTRVGNSFDANGNLSGRDFQQSIRGLRRDAKAMENLPYGHDFGQVTRQAEGALEGLLQRQAPGALPAYNAANAANRNVEILRDAVNRARSGTTTGDPGLFSAAQLSDAAAASSKKFGGTQGTTQQPFYDLTRAAQRVLPSKIADSGTATRAAVTAALGVGGAGGAGYVAGDGDGALSGAGGALAVAGLLAAGGSRTAQRQITRALLDRPDALVQLGNQVQRRARIGGLFGAPMLAGGGAYLAGQ